MKKFPDTTEWKLLQRLQEYVEKDDVEPGLCIAAMNWIDTFETRAFKDISTQEKLLTMADNVGW